MQEDIITTWSGVRPLLAVPGEAPEALSRDYAYHYVNKPAPAAVIYGGKITTYRQLSSQVVDVLKSLFPHMPKSQTVKHPLPGAATAQWGLEDYKYHAHEHYFWLDEAIKERYLTTYGTRTDLVLNGCLKPADMGEHFGCGLYQNEVDYLMREEWAQTIDDILLRRTKLGLQFAAQDKVRLAHYMDQNTQLCPI